MGGCTGKNKTDSNESNSTKKSKSKIKDNNLQSNSSSSLPKALPSSNVPTVNNNNSNGKSNAKENGIEPDIQVIIDQQNGITNTLGRTFPPRVISVTDSEFEIELANLVYGHPEVDYAENPPVATKFKSTEV